VNGEGRAVDGGRAAGNAHDAHNGVISMRLVEELAAEETRRKIELAEQLRTSRRLLTLRRARRMERKAEHRMVEAWRRAAELRGTLETADY
jgi:hypothetical protein